MKNKETLEDDAMNYLDRTYNLSYERTTWQKLHEKTFIASAKWQQEQDKNFYNKEDLWKSYKASNTIFEDEIALRQEFEKWFEKFKKK